MYSKLYKKKRIIFIVNCILYLRLGLNVSYILVQPEKKNGWAWMFPTS